MISARVDEDRHVAGPSVAILRGRAIFTIVQRGLGFGVVDNDVNNELVHSIVLLHSILGSLEVRYLGMEARVGGRSEWKGYLGINMGRGGGSSGGRNRLAAGL
jgi:hypothetical protein